MIQPQDLKIGNLLMTLSEEPEAIAVIAIDGIEGLVIMDSFDEWESLEDYAPIELTEQWLKDFKFKQLDKYTWVKDGWFVYKRKRGFVLGSKKREIKLSHVHTLQNFFALTGNELKHERL